MSIIILNLHTSIIENMKAYYETLALFRKIDTHDRNDVLVQPRNLLLRKVKLDDGNSSSSDSSDVLVI